jgi:hypothetical protein
MSIGKPSSGVGAKEPIKLDAAAAHLLEECRMVLPGIQALFGFQLIAVFNEGFSQKLPEGGQVLHYAAVVLVALAIALVMTPAALHRQTSQREVSERFIWISSGLVLGSMFPLAIGLCLEVYLVGVVVLKGHAIGAAAAAALFLVFMILWVWLPKNERRKHM